MRVGGTISRYLTAGKHLELHDGDVTRRLAATNAPLYQPTGALALSPDGSTVWTADASGRARRIDLGSGDAETFDFELVDVAYGGPGELVAVIAQGDDLALIELRDAAPTTHVRVELPRPQARDWFTDEGYRFETDDDPDWKRGTPVRIGASPWGIVVAQPSGLLCARRDGGAWQSWRVTPTFQGWSCGFCHPGGLVVTTMTNHRIGRIVWADADCTPHAVFDSGWHVTSPCVPSGDGFLVAIDDELVRLEGHPPQATSRAHIGGRAADAAVDASGAIFDLGDAIAFVATGALDVEVRRGDEHDRERLAPT